MVFDILKKDLKRKRTMNIILLLFISLATIFVSSSMNNIITVMNGTDYFFDKSNMGDYIILTSGEEAFDTMENTIAKESAIRETRLEDVIFASKEKFHINGEKIALKNVAMLQTAQPDKFHFFDERNQEVDKVQPGNVYISLSTMKNNQMKLGDELQIKHGTVELKLKVAGFVKDALFGSSLMGNSRFLISEEDYQKLLEDEEIREYYTGQICYIDLDEKIDIKSKLADVDGIMFSEPRDLIKKCHMIDMVVAGILLVVSLCLIIVSFVVLKFTITFTMTEEFREIGVMKAIGIKDGKIRSLYLTKYLAISIVGALIGLGFSYPVTDVMLRSVSTNMVLGNDYNVIINVISAVVVIIITILYAYFCTRKVKKYSPIDAIRSGQTGERFRKKSIYRLGKSKISSNGYLALNDIISSPRRYITVVSAFFLCTILVMMIVNTTATMSSDRLITTFGKKSDAYYNSVEKSMMGMTGQGDEAMKNVLKDIEKTLKDNEMPARVSVDVQYKLDVKANGKMVKISCQKGVGTTADEYEYYEGTAPQYDNEVAITEIVKEKLGIGIGDTITIDMGGEEQEFLVTAYFQSMNLMGEVIRLHEDAKTDTVHPTSALAFQIDFHKKLTQKEIDERIEKMKEIFETDEVFNVVDYTRDCISVVDTLEMVKFLLVGVTIVVVILVTILMERSFISEEKGEIAILKAMGFQDRSIIAWHMKRFGFVALVAVALAIALSIPATQLCITPIFKSMGMKSINYKIDVLQVFGMMPAIVVGVTLLFAWLTSLNIKKIRSRDTASIE